MNVTKDKAKTKKGHALTDISVDEVSLVGDPANKTSFALYKNADGVEPAGAPAGSTLHAAVCYAMMRIDEAVGAEPGLDSALFALASTIGSVTNFARDQHYAMRQEMAAKGDAGVNPDGSFVGGFDGCVAVQEGKGLSTESAKKLCAFIGRKAGKL